MRRIHLEVISIQFLSLQEDISDTSYGVYIWCKVLSYNFISSDKKFNIMVCYSRKLENVHGKIGCYN
jgi:hypothetical protein